MKIFGVLVLALAISACANDSAFEGATGNAGPGGKPGATGATGATGAQGPAGPAATPPPLTTVQQLIANQNSYRETLGQDPLTVGMACTVQAIASGTYLSSSSPGYTAAAAIVLTGTAYPYLLTVGFDQPNSGPGPNSAIDPEIQSLFVSNNYRISCTGDLVIAEDGYHNFELSSDDGSILTIDGTQVVNNDGAHGVTTLSGTKALQAGVHTFSLLYAQSASGNFALTLNQDGALLPAANLYH